MCLLVTPTYVVSVFTQVIQSYPADSVFALLPFSLLLALFFIMCFLAVTIATKIYFTHDLAVFMWLAPGQGLWFWLQWLQSVVFTGSGYVSAVLYNIFNVCCTIAFPACVMQCYYPQPIRPLPKAIVLWISLFVLFVGAQWCSVAHNNCAWVLAFLCRHCRVKYPVAVASGLSFSVCAWALSC